MIKQHSYLIFRINNSLYGVDTLSVKEIFLLPELTPIPQAPPGIVGVIDVRGHVLPVMDLNVRFGQQDRGNYSLTDQVIVLQQGEQDLGIIVNQVYGVRSIADTEMSGEIRYDGQSPTTNGHHFVAGIVRSENDILVIINLVNLLQYVAEPNYISKQEYLDRQIPAGYSSTEKTENGDSITVTQTTAGSLSDSQLKVTPEVLTILRERANRLRQIDRIRQHNHHALNLAIVSLNGELFSVDLHNVREFTNVEQVIPIPCCPPHIIGNMNLRGEILTLVDISRILNLPPINLTEVSQLMVVEVDDLRVGITIEKVRDTIAVDPEEIDLAPAASYATHKKFFRGTLSYQQEMISILDIVKILRNDNLIVARSG